MKKLLVIGATGTLGSRLLSLGKGRFEMLAADKKRPEGAPDTHELDACNREQAFALIEKLRPDCVIDAHALTNLDYCETHQEETWRVNYDGSLNIADACETVGCKYIFISTDNVFDGEKAAYTENDSVNPLNYYAKTKVAVEMALAEMDSDYIIARTAVLYGKEGQGRVGFVPWVIEKLKNKEEIRIVTDQKNNPTFVDNLCELLFRLYEKDERGIFHTTGGECLSRYDFSLAIAQVFGLDSKLIVPILSSELNQTALRPKTLNMLTEKVTRATGVTPISTGEGLRILKKELDIV
jgi:dTDP-4-dehydrorhamnose reductase